MNINIRDKSTGTPITTVHAVPLTTISQLKAIISSKTAFPTESQELFYGDRRLDDNKRLFYCDPNRNTIIDLVVTDGDGTFNSSKEMKIDSKLRDKSLEIDKDQTVSDESIVDNVDTTNFDKKTKLKIDALENELKLLKEKSDQDVKKKEAEYENGITTLKQKFENEKKKYEHNESKLESQAAKLSSMVDVEIERSVQLHEEKTLLQKKLTDLATRIQVDDLIDVMIETAYIQLQWKELGTVLGVPQSVLEEIARKHSTSSITRCHYEVMRYWIVEIGASWEALASALQSSEIKQETFADTIRQKYVNSRRGKRVQNNVLVLKDDESISSGADLIQYDIFTKVDWKVLGLLLGVSDDNLESISSDVDQCQQSMIDQWIETGQAYWPILIKALDGPVLGMTDVADRIAKDKLNQHTQQARAASNQHVVSCPYEIDEKQVERQKAKITATLQGHKGMLKGVVFIFGMTDVAGVYKDLENVRETFQTTLKFAVMRVDNPDGQFLANFIRAAATLRYEDYDEFANCKAKVFYFAGHGGIDTHKRPFFVPQQLNESQENKKDVILIRETILSHFQRVGPNQSFLFFFDCCLVASKPKNNGNLNDNKEIQSSDTDDSFTGDESFHLEAPLRCVIAYATSVGLVSIGDTKVGGRWTSSMCENIKKKIELGEVLALTHKDVMEKSEDKQPPQYHSCVGPIYLRGKLELPIKTKTETESNNVFKVFRCDLFELLSNNQTEVISLATRINVSSPWIVNKQMPSALGRMNKDEAASTLLNHIEKAFDENPKMLQDTYDSMENIDILVGIVKRMRESAKTSVSTVTTDMTKVLKEYKEKEVKLGNENADLKNTLSELQEESSKMEDHMEDMTKTLTKLKHKEVELGSKNADLKKQFNESHKESCKLKERAKVYEQIVQAKRLQDKKDKDMKKNKEKKKEEKKGGLGLLRDLLFGGNDEKTQYENKIAELETKIETLEENQEIMESEMLHDVEIENQGETTKIEKQVGELKMEIETLKRENSVVELNCENPIIMTESDEEDMSNMYEALMEDTESD